MVQKFPFPFSFSYFDHSASLESDTDVSLNDQKEKIKKAIETELESVYRINTNLTKKEIVDRLFTYVISFRPEGSLRVSPWTYKMIKNIFQSYMGFLFCQSEDYLWECIDHKHPFVPSSRSFYRIDSMSGLDDPVIIQQPFKARLLFSQHMSHDKGPTKGPTLYYHLMKLLQSARKEILLNMYGVRGLPGLAQLLRQKIKDGIKVKAVFDKLSPYQIRKKKRGKFHFVGTPLLIEALNNGASQGEVTMNNVNLESNGVGYIMHNKYIVVDGHTVWTGTANFTKSSLVEERNANTVVVINDSHIADSYRQEFWEMFGYSGYKGRFHRKKKPNTKRNFYFFSDHIQVRLFFAPTDDGEHRAILPALYQAKKNIRISMFSSGYGEIVHALQAVVEWGVRVQVILDERQVMNWNSWIVPYKYGKLRNKGHSKGHNKRYSKRYRKGYGKSYNRGRYFTSICETRSYNDQRPDLGGMEVRVENWPGLNHEKVGVIDDRVIIIGSQNWSYNGNNRNDENLILIEKQQGTPLKMILDYQDRFRDMWNDLNHRHVKDCKAFGY